MTKDSVGDPAAPSGSRQDGRAAAGVSPLRASIPIADIPRFLECFDILGRFEAHHTVIRHYGAFNPQEWPDRPDLSVMRVIRWLKSLAQGIEAPSGGETALAGSTSGESPVGDEPMRPDDPATIADLQRQLAEADAWIYCQRYPHDVSPEEMPTRKAVRFRDEAIARHEARKR